MFDLYTRKKVLILSLLVIFVIALSACSKGPEGVVAMVNDEEISQEDFDMEFEIYKATYENQLGEGALSQTGDDGITLESHIKETIIDTLVIERIIMQDAMDKGISVTDEEVDKKIEDLLESLGGDEEFEKFLEANFLTEEYFTKYTKNDIFLEKHSDDHVNSIQIDDEEAEEFFNENKEQLVVLRASHILVDREEDGNRILALLEGGGNFEDLATEESQDSLSAVNGGDLGYIIRGRYAEVPEFEQALFDLKVGEISDLIETEVGFHIIRLDEKRDTFEGLVDEIKDLLKNQEYTKFVEELKDKAKIKIYLDTK